MMFATIYFTETRFSSSDSNNTYSLEEYSLYRNDGQSSSRNTRPYGGTAVYNKVDYLPGYPYNCNMNGIEFTIIRVGMLPDVTIVGVYRSPQISEQQMCIALTNLLCSLPITPYQFFLGDFNMNWFEISNSVSV